MQFMNSVTALEHLCVETWLLFVFLCFQRQNQTYMALSLATVAFVTASLKAMEQVKALDVQSVPGCAGVPGAGIGVEIGGGADTAAIGCGTAVAGAGTAVAGAVPVQSPQLARQLVLIKAAYAWAVHSPICVYDAQ
jgi:hypothetical protein